ncbi:MAG: hypothetical protein P1U58_07780 [Verrucomicrobiales bacterium]|nr:hypothetical protein [Verrucomicrobiales bacterium]
MVIPRHQAVTAATRGLLSVFALVFLCQCSTRTVTVKKSTVSFADESDEDEIRKKFAEKGYSVGDDGVLVADKPNLYADSTPRGFDGKVETKMSKFADKKLSRKEFKTPEYLKVQEFRNTRDPQNFNQAAAESDSSRSQFNRGRKLFQTKTKDSSQFQKFAEKTAQNSKKESPFANKVYDESIIPNAAVAQGTVQKAGYRSNVGMTMDDVKKMLSPNVYADRQGL